MRCGNDNTALGAIRSSPRRLWYFAAVALIIGAAIVLIPSGTREGAVVPALVIAGQLIGLIAYVAGRRSSSQTTSGRRTRTMFYFVASVAFILVGGLLVFHLGDNRDFLALRWAVGAVASVLTVAGAWMLEARPTTRSVHNSC
jgi:hypothetical protein